MATKSQLIKQFLEANTWPDLAALYNLGMECQISVARDGGKPNQGEYKGRVWRAWTDGQYTWKSYRIPHNASTSPEYSDTPLGINNTTFDHIEAIGLSGWDWQNRISKFLGYDFDALVGHSEKHSKKLSDSELLDLEQAVASIPWVTLRQSTSGKGRHLYVFVPDVPTQNHTEHAALARAVLGIMSGLTNYDFISKVDVMGHIIWFWHRKLAHSNGEGLKLIKQGTTLQDVPPNWRDHISVIERRSRRAIPFFIKEREQFEELAGAYLRVPLDDEHRTLIDWLQANSLFSYWDNDFHMLVTHSSYLAKAYDELKLRGIYKTIATGSDGGSDHNLFMFPLRHGAWSVHRYTRGVAEAPTWTQDNKGFTHCYFNQDPDLSIACISAGGCENDKGGFVFPTVESAINAVRQLGVDFTFPPHMQGRRAIVRKAKSGKLVVEIEKGEGDSTQGMLNHGFTLEKKLWQKVFQISPSPVDEGSRLGSRNFDDEVRHLITEDNEEYGWAVNSEGVWQRYTSTTIIKMIMQSFNMPRLEAECAMGRMARRSWTVVNRPFQPEYLEGRTWNMRPAQFAVVPNLDDNRSFPTYQKILTHVGRNLDEPIRYNEWAKANGILTGADYLKCWLASVVQYPLEHLPYLFLYGDEDSGKSTFHQCLRFLFTRGIARADNALVNTQGFNAELEHAIVAVIEEVNLSKPGSQAYSRIKDWVLAPDMPVHKKGRTPFLQPNSTHWIQVANDISFVPVGFGDTRIVVLRVDTIPSDNKVPRRFFEVSLKKEAPDFLGELLSIELPDPIDRFNIPVIVTSEKSRAQISNATPLQTFLHQQCYYIPGSKILSQEFKTLFHSWLDEQGMSDEKGKWSTQKIHLGLPDTYSYGHDRSTHQMYVLNISTDKDTPPGRKLIVKGATIDYEPQLESMSSTNGKT